MRYVITLVLGMLVPLLSIGQDPFCIKIDATQGLPSKNVYSLLQDSKGFIWASTDQGLSRFDGQSFKTYTSSVQSSRSGANINEDRYGRIWYQNFDGYCYYVEDDSLHALAQDSALSFLRAGILGDYWVVPRGAGADVYDLKTLGKVRTVSLPSNIYVSVFGATRWWVTTDSGTYACSPRGEVDYYRKRPSHLQEGGVVTEWKGRGISLEAMRASAPVLAYKDRQRAELAQDLMQGIAQLIESSGEELWVCSSTGARVLREEGGKVVASPLMFTNYSIGSVIVDRDGNHWLGTLGNGILLVQDIHSPLIPAPSSAIARVCATPMGLCMGTRSGEILLLPRGAQEMQPFYAFQGGHAIDFLHYDSTDQWLITGNPSTTILNARREIVQELKFATKDIVRLENGYYAASGSSVSGLFRTPAAIHRKAASPWENLIATYPNPQDSNLHTLLGGRGRAVGWTACDPKILFGTSNGLVESDGLSQHEIRYHGQRFFAAEIEPVQQRLLMRSTLGAMLWMGCDSALKPVQGIDFLAPFVAMRVHGDDVFLLCQSGLHQMEVAGDSLRLRRTLLHINPLLVNDFTIWERQVALATDEGILLVNLVENRPAVKPNFVLTGLKIHGQRFATDRPVSVPADENDVEITYSVLAFGTGANYPVYYRVNGGIWERIPADSRSLQFASLSPDDYRIEFCLNEPCDEIVADIRVTIRKPFWMSFWFWGMLVVLSLLIGLGIVRWRFRINARKQLQKVQQLELENNLNQSMLTALRSQMNPHFFFNALNTIQSFIYANEKKNATEYLAKFSQLTRMVLEMSAREMVSLRDEVESLQLYLELEKARFEESLDFKIEVDPGLELDGTWLPSMIVQPLCENALKHGLLHRSGDRRLLLRFSKDGDRLVVVVDDNGIGRKRSGELNRIRSDKHQSFATLATAKRIALLNLSQHNIQVDYIDKMSPEGLAEGTTVILKIQLKSTASHV